MCSFLCAVCRYNKLCGMVTKLTALLKRLDPSDAFRIEMTDQLLKKLSVTPRAIHTPFLSSFMLLVKMPGLPSSC